MAAIINFIWQSIICLLFFYAFYWVFLKDEKTFVFNRIYLLTTPFLAIAFSLIEIPVSFEKPSISLENTAFLKALEFDAQKEIAGTYGLPEVTVTGSRLPTLWGITDYLLLAYLIVAIFLFAKFYWQFLQLKQILRKGWYQTTFILKDNYFKVPTFGLTPVFSYFDKIFWDDELELNHKEKKQILNHEIEHVKQKHTYDVIIYQIMCNVFWFNPIIHLMQKALIDLHEFQADESVIKDLELKDSYPKLVAKMAFQGLDLSLGNYFIRSTTLKRIQMMKANRKTNWFKLAMLVPLMIMVFGLISMKSNNSIISFNNYSTLPISFLKNQIVAFQDSIAVGIKLKNVKNPTHYESIGKLKHESLNVQVGELSYEFTGIKNQQEYIKVLNLVESLRPNSTLNKKYENAYPYYSIDHKPEPKIGWDAWENYLTNQIPKELIDEIYINGGSVELEFVVDQEAKIVSPSIKKSLGEEVDQILLASLIDTKAPAWLPGKKDNEIVAVVVNAKIELENPNQQNDKKVTLISSTTNNRTSVQNTKTKSFPENLAIELRDDLKSGAITLGNSFKKHMAKTLSFPKETIKNNISGTAIVRLKTNSKGRLTDISFVKSIDQSFEKAILNVLADAPNLVPVHQYKGYELLLPISFKINGSNINNIIPGLNEDYGDVIYINGYKAEENRFTSDPIESKVDEIPVHIIKEGLVNFNGVIMPINTSLSKIMNAYIRHFSINPQSISINFSAEKDVKMGEVQNVKFALREVGIRKINFRESGEQVGNSDSAPVYLIDGVFFPNPKVMDYPNPENIKTISIVGPDKMNIYGSKAKNGVIVITTN